MRAGSDVNAQNIVGDAPLHKAAFNGRVLAAGYLIRTGANVNIRYCLPYTEPEGSIQHNYYGAVSIHREKAENMKMNYRPEYSTSDFFSFRFFGFHFEYGLITVEGYSRRQINTGTKFELSHLHNIFVDIGRSGP